MVDEQLLTIHAAARQAFQCSGGSQCSVSLSDQQRQLLVDDFVQNEVLLGGSFLDLDRDDPIRRRLIQKMDYLAQGFYDRAGANLKG